MIPSSQVTSTNEFLLPGMEALVPLAIMLTCECLSTNRTDKRSLVCMGAKVRSQIVGARKPLWAKGALKCGRMLLMALRIIRGSSWPLRISKVKNEVPALD